MLPLIEKYAARAFAHLDAEAKEDAVSEVVANAMCAYRRLHERDELDRAFASALTKFAVRQFHDGRRVGASQSSRDVFSTLARRKGGFDLCSLDVHRDETGGAWVESLVDDRRTPIPDQVSFRIDFPRWLNTQTDRNQQIADRLAQGDLPSEIATDYGISRARVSQLRRELAESWYEYINGVLEEEDQEADELLARLAGMN